VTGSVFGDERSERLRSQRRAVRMLGELLDGPGRELPPLRWTVFNHARLLGNIESHDPDAGRQQFDAWVQALGATPWPERDLGFKVTLSAERKHYDGLVTVGLVADLDKPDGDR
jgi:hypothetical protein